MTSPLSVTVTPPSSPSSQSKAVAEFPYRDSDIENLSEEEIVDACNAASKEIQFGIARIANSPENDSQVRGWGRLGRS